ncbi:MAG: M48 family metalloprotease [Acidobacteriota bacterium]
MRTRLLAISALAVVSLAFTPARATVKLDGYAEFREGQYLIVDGQRVQVTSRTRFRGKGRARSFYSIPLGYQVRVWGKRRPDGSVKAIRIEAQSNRDTSDDRELREAFDRIEQKYRELGRMKITDDKGKVLEDYGPLIEQGPMVNRVRRIMARLVPPYLNANDLRVYVVENDDWNAMAAPNFSIYVFSGLLKDLDDDEVAIVLGHELAHATHEHSRRQYKRGRWVQLGALAASIAGRTIDNPTTQEATLQGTRLATAAIFNGYSRKHEDQADRVGLRYAYEAGYDVSKGPKLWEKFAKKYGDTGKVTNFFFGNHSRASRREKLLRQEILYNYPEPGKVARGSDR